VVFISWRPTKALSRKGSLLVDRAKGFYALEMKRIMDICSIGFEQLALPPAAPPKALALCIEMVTEIFKFCY